MPPPAHDDRRSRLSPRRRDAFTLIELLVSMSVLVLLVLLVGQLFSSAVNVTTQGNKRIDADEQARVLFDRMAVDFARMVKRADVDYFVKQPPATYAQPGNDQIAFYSEVPGYSPLTGTLSPVSLVAYRVNADSNSVDYQKVERLGKGLAWNGSSATDSPLLFLPVPLATPLPPPTPMPSPTPTPIPAPIPTPAWPQAGDAKAVDSSYELIGPQIFRLEYYYLLKGQYVGGVNYASSLSETPWNVHILGHYSVAGMQDVAAVVVTIAVIDPKSQVLVTNDQLGALAGQLADFTSGSLPDGTDGSQPGALEAYWQKTINAGVAGVPAGASKWVRIFHRYFYLNLPQ